MGERYHDSIFWVEVERIRPNPFQPRREFDELKLQDLADSVRQYGVLQPLVVTRKEYEREDGGISVEYELIAGERRLRASKVAGLSQVPVIIRAQEESDQVKLELAIIENLQREDINPIERARAFAQLVNQFNLKHADVGKKIGRSREYVSNTLRLLSLPTHIQEYIIQGRIAEGHTRPILRLNGKSEEQDVLVKEIMLKKLTVREAESIAQRIAHETNKQRTKEALNPELMELERELTENLGTRVQIEPREVGGKLVISYFSADDLSSLLSLMKAQHQVPASIIEGEQVYDTQDAPLPGGEPPAAQWAALTEATPLDEENLMQDDVPSEEGRYWEEAEADEPDLYSIRNFSI
ncbi:ParB/RepB/Spo0J family partition protein [Patescibacteria group bacterium]|jgi:ParB family chromosome partitioning protein|nr:ParB/RepB/Spo0J family partition protein [Patescibacteria group bacterium]